MLDELLDRNGSLYSKSMQRWFIKDNTWNDKNGTELYEGDICKNNQIYMK